MAIALDCPHCGNAKVETVRNAWYIQGFLLFARYGSKPYIGCNSCTRTKVVGSLVLTSVIGWWCFPWGLGTPLVIVQNLVALTGNDDERGLRSLLLQQGIDYDDLEVDERGRSAGQQKLIDGILGTLHEMVWADGEADPAEIEVGADIGSRMLGEMVPHDEIVAALSGTESPGIYDPVGLDEEARVLLLRAAGEVAIADGVIADEEREVLRKQAHRLSLPEELADRLLEILSEQLAGDADDTEKQLAAELLDVPVDADVHEVRQAYELAMIGCAGDEDEADTRDQLAWAHRVMLGLPEAA